MSILKKVTPGKRKLSLVLVMVLILGSFFSLYFFKYLPANKEELNKRGFRILRQISDNISEKNSEYKNRINKIIKSPSLSDSLYDNQTGRFRDNDTIKKIIAVKFTHLNDLELKSIHRIDSPDRRFLALGDSVLETAISLKKNETWKQRYQTDCYTDSDAIRISFEGDLNKYLTTIINSRKDLFETYLIISATPNRDTSGNAATSAATIVYQSDNLTLSNATDYDTLLPGRATGNISGVRTIELSGIPYILFSKPMTWDENNLILVGLVKKGIYNSKYLSVSSGLIYAVCIILLLLVFSLPFIKIALITSREKLQVRDVVMAGVTLVLGTALLVIILTDWLLFRNLEEKKQRQLNNLSDSVQKGFEAEIKAAYLQVKDFDRAAVQQEKWLVDQSDYTGDSLFLNPSHYKTFDQVFWVMADGMQQAKWETHRALTPKINLKDRNYFRRTIYGDAYEYPMAGDTARFFIEPVYSNISAEFKVILSTRSCASKKGDSLIAIHSQLPNAGARSLFRTDSILRETKVVALGTRMYTEPNPILPREFGFCIVDESGKVLVHSDIKRSLLENLIEESNDNAALQQAIKRREDKMIRNVIYYGDPHTVRVRPFKHLPLYLVTYFNRVDVVNTNSRIVAITMLLSLFLFSFLLLTHRMFRSGHHKVSKLNFPAGQYNWFKPQRNSIADLFFISRFLLAYLTLGVAFNLLDALMVAESVWVMLINMLLIPFYSYLGIYSIKRSLTDPILRKRPKYLHFFIIMAFINLLLVYYTNGDQPENLHITRLYLHNVLFQLLSLLLIAIFSRHFIERNRQLPSVDFGKPSWVPLLSNYSRSMVLLLIAISVIPPVTFLYFAFNEEKMQSVKTRQLQLAMDVQQRNRKMEARHKKQKKYKDAVYATFYSRSFIDSLIKTKDIYTGDKLDTLPATTKAPDPAVALNNLSFYGNLLSLVPGMKMLGDTSYQLRNAASDSAWYWVENVRPNQKGISLFYQGIGEQKLPLRIDSATPPYLRSAMGVWPFAALFICIVTGVLYALFRLIRYMARTIFLIGYHESFHACAVEQRFLEKFASYIRMEKIIVLDDKNFYQQHKEQFNGSCEIVQVHPGDDPELLADTIRKSGKRFILVNNGDDHIMKNLLLKLNVQEDVSSDQDEWQVVLIVKPKKLKKPVQFPAELLEAGDGNGWSEKVIQSLNGSFDLFEKNEYARILHMRLRRLENRHAAQKSQGRHFLDNDDYILHTQHHFEQNYEALWNACTEQERFILYDFALDEFANYRNEYIIHRLIRHGILIYEEGSLRMMNESFRNFVLTKSGTMELEETGKGLPKSDKWDVFRISLIVMVSAVALFVFFTQEEVFQQISAALASVVALGSMLFKFMEGAKSATTSDIAAK